MTLVEIDSFFGVSTSVDMSLDDGFLFGGLLGLVTFESAGNFTDSMAEVKMNEPDDLQNYTVIDSGSGVESGCGVF